MQTEMDSADADTPPEPTGETPEARAIRLLADLIGPKVTPPPAVIDEAKVRQMIDDALATRPGSTVTLVTPSGETVKIEGAHYLMPRLLRIIAARDTHGDRLYPFAWGPAGSGKTSAMLAAAKALAGKGERAGEIDTLDPSTPKSALMGFRYPDKTNATTQWSRCWEDGGLYIGDEIDYAPAHVQSLKNSSLANGHSPLAWGSMERHDRFGAGYTGNTPGRPTLAFPDRLPMSPAFKDRLYFIHWPVDENIERRFAGLPEIARPAEPRIVCTRQEWGAFVLAMRAWCEKNAPDQIVVTPRATFAGWLAIDGAGETPEQAAHGVIFRGADDALVAKALAAVPLPGRPVAE